MRLLMMLLTCLFVASSIFAENQVLNASPQNEGNRIQSSIHRKKGLSSTERVYPVMDKGNLELAPEVSFATHDSSIGGTIRMAWDEKGLMIELTVIDPTSGPVADGAGMWVNDSVQIAIDTNPDMKKTGYTKSCYELGFALQGDNNVLHHAWNTGASDTFDWSKVDAKGNRTADGYHFNILIPWNNLGLDPAKLPRRLGINVLVCNNAGERTYVEWTPGIGESKSPNLFIHAVLVDSSRDDKVTRLLFIPETRSEDYEEKDLVKVNYVEYAITNLPARKLKIQAIQEDNDSAILLKELSLPKTDINQLCEAEITFPAGTLKDVGRYRIVAQSGDTIESESLLNRKNTNTKVENVMGQIREKMKAVDLALASHPEMAADSYVCMGNAITKRFMDRITTNQQQTPDWSLLQAQEILWILEKTLERIERNTPMVIHRPEPGPIHIRNGSFYDNQDQPCFFGGYGHFGTVEREIPIVGQFGANLVQLERGPSMLNPDCTLSDDAKAFKGTLQFAAANQMKIDLMLAPHYFPHWISVIDKDDKPVESPMFIRYNIDHPNARKLIRAWLEEFVPYVKDEPALFSVNLSNEPTYSNSGRDKYSRPLWIEYLEQRHTTINELNALYGTKYKSFEDVPVPGIEMPKDIKAKRAYYDWIVFNQKHFADWHAWMNQIVKGVAPNIPTSIKMMNTIFDREHFHWGIDPERICRVTDIAGNDAHAYVLEKGAYAYDWLSQMTWYDLLHSFRGQPVYNSENHFIPDVAPPHSISPEFTYSVLWQGGLHHLGATTTWVWDEPVNDNLKGSIYLRPANIYAAGKAWFDLSRLAKEVTAINNHKAKIAILYSVPSVFWQTDYGEAVRELYAAVACSGLPVTFISERQLAEGTGPDVDWILLPHATHVTRDTLKALKTFSEGKGKIIGLGKYCLAFDEYHRPLPKADQPTITASFPHSLKNQALAESVRSVLDMNNVSRMKLTDVNTGNEAWGIEYRTVPYNNTILIPIINMLRKPMTVKLPAEGPVVDLISGDTIDPSRLVLDPMTPLLLQIQKS